MQCLILAGGLGTRMQSVGQSLPKALLPVGQQTFIDWQLQWLKLLGVREVVMALGHGGEQIQSHIQRSAAEKKFPSLQFVFDGPTLLGTGGAIKNAAGVLHEDFFVAYGDTIFFVNMIKMMRTHTKQKLPLTISIMKNQNQGDTSNVIYRDGHFFYDKFNIVPEMEYIDYGVSALNKSYFLQNAPAGPFDLARFMTQACKDKKATPFLVKEHFHEIGSPSGYLGFQNFIKENDGDLKKIATQRGLI